MSLSSDSSEGKCRNSLHQLVRSALGGVAARSEVRQREERSREGLTGRAPAMDEGSQPPTLLDRPLEKTSAGAGAREAGEDWSEWDAAGEETTRLMSGASPRASENVVESIASSVRRGRQPGPGRCKSEGWE